MSEPEKEKAPLPDDESQQRWEEPVVASFADPQPLPDTMRQPFPDNEVTEAQLVELVEAREVAPQTRPQPTPSPRRRRRRVRLPAMLFLATVLSTFWVGANQWAVLPLGTPFRQAIIAHWQDGLIYMFCVLAILLTHEMGHFLATLRYRIPASFPYFIPFPISPIGTMGAVIGMEGMRADRKEMFDIGLAGPLAGLVVAVPIMWIGILKLDLTQPGYGPYTVDMPLLMRLTYDYLQPTGYVRGSLVWFSQLNPYFMAGWVGLLITGLNMLPVSQLDGGHVIYTLFGKRAHWIARGFVTMAIAYIIIQREYTWVVMLLLVLFIGTDHPPTRDDTVPIGRLRYVLGCASILIPVFCFAPRLLIIPN